MWCVSEMYVTLVAPSFLCIIMPIKQVNDGFPFPYHSPCYNRPFLHKDFGCPEGHV